MTDQGQIKQRVGLVLAAAGGGTRVGGDIPKQFLEIKGRPVYRVALEAFDGIVDEAVVVVPAAMVGVVRGQLSDITSLRVEVVAGGSSRQQSVGIGLDALSADVGWVLVHDAARPFVSAELIRRVLRCAVEHEACIPVLPVSDTVKEIVGGVIRRTLPRESLGLAQTPQGFRCTLLKAALVHANGLGLSGTDEAQLVEAAGNAVHVVEGEASNLKITWPQDFPES